VLELTLRLIFSLAVVVGLLMLLARYGAKRFNGGTGSLVQVVHRQALSRSSSVAVVTVGSRVLVLGTTEQNVTVLTELDPEELVTEEQVALALEGGSDEGEADGLPRPTVGTTPTHAPGALAGSLLSAATWKQALAVLSSPRKTSS